MFVEDFRNQFYDQIIGKRILIMVNYDVDGICACKILQSLFKHDNIPYSLVPIMGLSSLKRTYGEYRDVKYVVLINCGGCVDIVELLQPEEDVIFYICDSHRPLDVCNIYSNNQVCILTHSINLEENIPPFESIFYESDEDDANETHNTGHVAKRNKQKWENERDRLMFDYTKYNFFGRSSSLVMFDLAWKMSKDCMEILWWAIVGTTEQMILGKIENSSYVLEESAIHSHISRLNGIHMKNNQTALKIVLEKDLILSLYRHWSIHDSLRYTMYTACKLKLWTSRGEKKVLELLAEVGLPLNQAKQLFSSMDLNFRREFKEAAEKIAEKFGVPGLTANSFTLNYGYCNKFSASDYVYAIIASLVCSGNRKPEDRFLNAIDILSRSKKEILMDGINKAKAFLGAVYKQVQLCLEMNQVNLSGSLLYYIMSEENMYFSHPYGALILGRFLLNCYASASRNRRAAELPLIVTCLIDTKTDLSLLVGIPPLKEACSRNFFGKAFQQAASRSSSSILLDFFDASIIQIRQSHVPRFLDTLSILIE